MPPEPADMNVMQQMRRLVAFAAIAIAIALSFYNGFLEPFSLGAMTLAAAAGLGAALLGRRLSITFRPLQPGSRVSRAPADLLWLGIMVSIGVNLLLPPGYDEDWPRLGAWRPLVIATGICALSYRWQHLPAAFIRARFPLFLALATAMALVVIRAVPDPSIDVWNIQQIGVEQLLRGQNPYTTKYPNIYHAGSPFLAKATLSADGTHILWNPYPPLTLLLELPSRVLAQDVRWTMVVCMLFAAWAIRRLGRCVLSAELAAILLLMQPRTFFVIRQSWTEPTVLAALLLTLLAAAMWCQRVEAAPAGVKPPGATGWIATGLAGALLAASKQYSPILLVPLFFALPERGRWKATALAIGGAAVIMLPFLLWDPRGFFNGVVVFQFLQPFRNDALSWLAAVARLGGPRLPPWPAFALAAATLGVTLKQRVSHAQAITAAGAAFMVLLLLNKQAFCNYYWLAGGLFCTATALHAGRLPAGGNEAESISLAACARMQ